MKKILVIGGMGFVGRNINISRDDYYLYSLDIVHDKGIDNLYTKHFKGDICSLEGQSLVKGVSPEILVVLAGRQFLSPPQKRKERETSFKLNTEIAHSILRICTETPSIQKVIYVSTDMVYGKSSDDVISEENIPKPIGPYGRSKLDAEKILSSLQCNLVILRPRLIIGPGRTGTVELLSKFIRLGLPIPIIGNGENRYQMISVFDLWSAIEILIEGKVSGIYNIGSDNPPTLNKLLPNSLASLNKKNKICKLPNKPTEALLRILDFIGISPLAPEQFEIAGLNCLLDTSKIKSIGWTPRYSDEQMLTDSLSKLI
jgi:dTDP-glucose 4,6-dehydratase